MQLKIYRYTIGIYSAVLLASLALFYLLPKEILLDSGLDAGGSVDIEAYREAALAGELDRLEGLGPFKEWRFEFKGDRLEIVPGGGEPGSEPEIVLKRTAAGRGELTAAEYRSGTFLGAGLTPYQVDLRGSRLSVGSPGCQEFKFRLFDRDFTANQFRESEDVAYHAQIFHELEFSQQFYLYIPVGVQIDYDPDEIFIFIQDDLE